MEKKRRRCKTNIDIGIVDHLLSAVFYRHGKRVSRHKVTFLVLPLFVVVITGFGLTRMRIDTEVEYLFIPEGSQGLAEKALAESLFQKHTDSVEFIPNRLTDIMISRGQLIITRTNGENILEESTITKILDLDILVRNISAVNENGTSYNFESLCMHWMGRCSPNPLIEIYKSARLQNRTVQLTYPSVTLPSKHSILISSQLGNVELHANTSLVEKAEAVILLYQLTGLFSYKNMTDLWENEFERLIQEFSMEFESDLNIKYVTSHTLSREINAATRSVLPRFVATFLMIIVFAVFSLMASDWVVSKPLLALGGVASAGFAITSSFGLLCLCGLPFNEVVSMMPFLVIGVGVDNMFIMVAAWRQLDICLSVEERMAKSFSEAAVSITITNLTDVLAFIVGASTPLPGMRIFCVYAGISMCFAYFYQVTFFAACMAISGEREMQNRHCITFRKVHPKEKSFHPFYKLFCAGGVLRDNVTHIEKYVHLFVLRVFRDYYGPSITNWYVKLFAVVLFWGFFVGSIIGITQLQEGLRLQNLAPDHSPPWEFYHSRDEFLTSFSPPVALIFSENIPYWDKSMQTQIENVTQTFEASRFVHGTDGTVSWVRDYLTYLRSRGKPAELSKTEFLQILRQEFLQVGYYKQYEMDIVFDKNLSDIVATRIILSTQDVHDGYGERDMMLELRRLAEEAPINITSFSPLFMTFDQYVNIIPYTFQTLGLAMLCMFCVAMVLIPHPICAIFVTLCAISIDTAVIGYMSLWDVSLDILSMINIVLCIGFSVDFSAHITYAFVVAPEKDSSRRAAWALRSYGMPILQGALSTMIAIFPLQSATVYIFRTFFKTLFLVMLFGALHGLLFLPVLLSLCGRFITTNKKRHDSPDNRDTPQYDIFLIQGVVSTESKEVIEKMITTL